MHPTDIIPSLVDYESRIEVIDYSSNLLKEEDVCVELGTFMGGTICRLGHNLKNKKCKIYAIDNWKYINISKASLDQGQINNSSDGYSLFLSYLEKFNLKINIIIEDTIIAANLFEDKSVNYLFMDANHNYSELVTELRAWIPKLNERCLIAVHDWSDLAVQKAILDEWGSPVRVTSNDATAILKDTL